MLRSVSALTLKTDWAPTRTEEEESVESVTPCFGSLRAQDPDGHLVSAEGRVPARLEWSDPFWLDR